MGTIQVISKTYCCVDNKDRNIFNEDLDEDSDDDEDDNGDDKQVIEKINSFDTDINKSQLLEI
jgi:hypothetical protein